MLKYYYDLLSQPSRALYIFLNKTRIPYEKCLVNLGKGAHKHDEYKLIHPFQQVPAIDDGGFRLFESVAIMRYLCNAYPSYVADHWYPKDNKKQALVDQYMEWQHANTRFNCAMYFQQKKPLPVYVVYAQTLIPLMTGNPPKQSLVDRFQAGMETTLHNFENFWLKEKKFLAGEEISVADIFAVCELLQPGISGYDVFKDHALLSKWYEAVKTELNPELEESNTFLHKLTKMAAASKL